MWKLLEEEEYMYVVFVVHALSPMLANAPLDVGSSRLKSDLDRNLGCAFQY